MGQELQVLPPGAGYGIVIGIGGIFALFMLGISWLQNRYTQFSTHRAEEFNTASRSVKPGLISAGIVSSWTWSATLLTSSTFAYSYGVCGPMWYGAIGTLQILLFALIAVKIKANAPGAHTMPEIVLTRHGNVAHLTYLYNGLATNLLVSACLVLGGAQVVAALTGMNVYAAIFLIPAVVAAYVIVGGLRATFIADYTHTIILFIAILVFGFSVSATSDLIGSPGRLYDLLQEASKNMPIDRNTDGSYLAFRSVGGLIFAVDIFVSGFSTVWLDQAYWQRAIASRPESSVKAYMLGGLAWYGIPFGFATAMGLGCAALTTNPSFPTYPNPLSAEQIDAGLSAPATAITLLGKGGAVLMLILLFMAVTSSTSAELIAVSSLLTFDVYKTYIRPNTDSATLVRVSHWGIVIYAIILAAFCCILNAAGVSLTWLLTVLGVIVGGAAIPVGLILLWDRMSTVAAIAAPWIGFSLGLIVWFVTSWKRSGGISVATTGDATNAVAGNLASFGVGTISAVCLSLLFPGKRIPDTEKTGSITGIPIQSKEPTTEHPPNEKQTTDILTTPASNDAPPQKAEPQNEIIQYLETDAIEPMDPVLVRKAERIAWTANGVFIGVAVILVPFTLFGTRYVYTKEFFTGWVVVSLIWVWMSVIICVVYPVVESAGALRYISRGVWGDIWGEKKEQRGVEEGV
ncbi:solute symporter family transporter [Aspergillus sclerotioniger CBS 115572]|uniref:Solute symporter family transporter n=1 Tax=Aspergillus sclerotioniger CBS 115572 TaxID=1450535 RepID=A0A317X878_9EURO|nr:solute symporter family transporter [Aspergillus sclerotioniger CBS 115572]PWY93108.1 solute symporter family transporter [Aspergillus sclerotioniger CBS 115572]